MRLGIIKFPYHFHGRCDQPVKETGGHADARAKLDPGEGRIVRGVPGFPSVQEEDAAPSPPKRSWGAFDRGKDFVEGVLVQVS